MAETVGEKIATNSNDVLQQVRCFLKGSVYKNRLCNDELIKSALFLLKNVPATRQAVLEYLCQVFDEACATHRRMEHDKKTDSAGDSQKNAYENVMLEIQTVLHSFLKQRPQVWAPIISTWSIELLGQISGKYTERRGMASNLNELLQLWMSCQPTKILIEIASDCFASMVGTTPEVCVDALLEASVKYSPHFDWVVAHIGSCFPKTVINRVLMSGLKEYHHHGNGMLYPPTTAEKKVPKLASVVGILGHLAGHHSGDIHHALMGLFKDSFQPNTPAIYGCAVQYLLQLASMSPILLRALSSDLFSTLTPHALNQLSVRYQQNPPKEPKAVINLIVYLICRSSEDPYKIVQFFLNTAAPLATNPNAMETDDQVNPVVQETCATVMNWLLLDLQRSVSMSAENAMEVPFLQTLVPHTVKLARELATSDGQRSLWLSRLLTFLCVHTSEHDTAICLGTILTSATSVHQLGILLSMLKELSIKYPDLLKVMLTEIMAHFKVRHEGQEVKERTVQNLLQLVQWEKENKEDFSGLSFCASLESHLHILGIQLYSERSSTYRYSVIQLLVTIGLPDTLTPDLGAELSCAWTACLFDSLMIEDPTEKFKICHNCSRCLQKLCATSCTDQKIVLRYLLEGMLSKELRELFGGKPEEPKLLPPSSLSLKSTLDRPIGALLKDSIQSGGRSVIFHAGVIGQGLRPPPKVSSVSQEQQEINKQIFMDTLWSCCYSNPLNITKREGSPTPSGSSPPPSPSPIRASPTKQNKDMMSEDFARDLALIVIELAAPDVMYNGMLWPEEDFMKVTVERDLLIKKKYEENPILWDIMELLAQAPGALSYCSVLLRALTATLITFWESSRLQVTTESTWQLDASVKVIELMRRGGLLASPLSYIGELFPKLTPYEVYLLLIGVWKFMKDNPPDPRINRREGCHSVYLDGLRYIFQCNITKLGYLYPRFFTEKPHTQQ